MRAAKHWTKTATSAPKPNSANWHKQPARRPTPPSTGKLTPRIVRATHSSGKGEGRRAQDAGSPRNHEQRPGEGYADTWQTPRKRFRNAQGKIASTFCARAKRLTAGPRDFGQNCSWPEQSRPAEQSDSVLGDLRRDRVAKGAGGSLCFHVRPC